ncbi:uncharacterized protein LOC123317711 [Coccinella septempunctata]|uniref:uncharacterized protein LOC123317711 n=1 Tax=Coccinella septempunctata TaxID=41139 RepID=UPI001D091AED|nr:uncharacterized protein LOC123317711 [Coccinella septempunctata]
MESAVKEAEIIEMVDTSSELTSAATKSTNRGRLNANFYSENIIRNPVEEGHSSKYPPVSTTIHNQELDKNQIVSDWVNAINSSQIDDYPNPVIQNKVESDVDKLCKALSVVLRTVNPAPTKVKPDAFFARQSIERECPIFDGKSEDWPIFISHFRKISTMCDFTKEESMMKLQKCLRGEAKQAVAGMMISPENIEQVIKTLEMRFGRPDQIIDTILDKLKTFYPIRENDMEKIIQFASYVNSLVSTIKSLNYDAHLQNPSVLKMMLRKLPDMLKLRWGEEILKKNGDVNLEDFALWLMQIANAACFVTTPRTSYDTKNTSRTQNFYNKKIEKTLMISTSRNSMNCGYCSSNGHTTNKCENIVADDIETRWKTVTKNKLCFSCLRNNHQAVKCRLKKICGVNGCKRFHHRYLHEDETTKIPNEETQENAGPVNSYEPLFTTRDGGSVLLRMINVKIFGNGRIIHTVALCDEASSVSLIDHSLLEDLNIHGEVQPLCVQWTNQMTARHEDSICVNLKISGNYEEAKTFTMKNVRSVKNLSLPKQHVSASEWQKLSFLNGIPLEDICEQPMILIGQDNIRLTLPRRIIQGPEHLPIATKTHLGWILHGNTSGRTEEKYIFHICDNNLSDEKFHVCDNPYSDEMLHKLVKKSSTLDAFGVSASAQTKRDKENDRAVDVMKRTINRIGQRFEIGLLWKEDDMKLPESKSVAYRRLLCVEKQMLKDDIFKKKYCDNIQKYIDKGYARKLTGEEAKKEGARTWYLPHFGVINPHKPQKLRLVFDAAAKSHGIFLNSNLLAGPDYLQSLVAVLIRFRERKVAFSSDIREMFHQVRITEIDQDSQRFLWRNGETNRHCDVYQMQVMTFGATCSPTCAQYVKNCNARQVGTSDRVIEAITRRHYVDDYLDCVDSPLEAYNLITEVSRTQSEAGFELVNWTTNSKELMKMMSFDENLNKDLNLDMEMSLQRVLGLSWSSAEDKLVFKLNFHPEQNRERPTKRHVLRIIMSVFDPLGFLVNFIIRGRILVQDIWRSGIGWDDFIDDDIYKTWLLWLADLQKVISLKIPRCYSLKIPVAESIELHVFCDSSKKAFAAVAYLRIIHACGIDI